MIDFSLTSFIIYVIYLLLVGSLISFYSKVFISDAIKKKRFIQGFWLKIFSGLSFIIIHASFYGYLGDSYQYYLASSELLQSFIEFPQYLFNFFLNDSIGIKDLSSNIIWHHPFLNGTEETFFSKIVFITSIIGMNNYMVMTLFFSTFAFICCWTIYKCFSRYFITAEKNIFFAFFLLPSLFFWGGSILKDGFIFSILCLVISIYMNFLHSKKLRITTIAVLTVSLFVMLNIKIYVLLSIIPAILISLGLYYASFFKVKISRIFFQVILFIFMMFSSLYLSVSFADSSNKYELENIETRVEGFHTWHTTQGGSVYDIGEFEFTPLGILKKVPTSLNHTFFRPFIWEVKNSVMLLAALESAFLLILFFKYPIVKLKLTNWILIIKNNPIYLMMFIYCLILGFSVGFTSYNYGALVRYKIPCLSFFYLLLVLPIKDELKLASK